MIFGKMIFTRREKKNVKTKWEMSLLEKLLAVCSVKNEYGLLNRRITSCVVFCGSYNLRDSRKANKNPVVRKRISLFSPLLSLQKFC